MAVCQNARTYQILSRLASGVQHRTETFETVTSVRSAEVLALETAPLTGAVLTLSLVVRRIFRFPLSSMQLYRQLIRTLTSVKVAQLHIVLYSSLNSANR
jgi:hypothetical protein